MTDLNTLAGFFNKMPYCYGKDKDGNEKMERVYPAYPWKLKSGDHSNEDPRFFSAVATKYGLINHLYKEHMATTDIPITYTEWVERHKEEEGWINHMEEAWNTQEM